MLLILEHVKNKDLKYFLNEKINSEGNKESMKFWVKKKQAKLYLSEEKDNVCLKQMNRVLSCFTLMKLEEVMTKQIFKYVLYNFWQFMEVLMFTLFSELLLTANVIYFTGPCEVA